MKKVYKYVLFMLFAFTVILINAKAEDSCPYKEQAALNKEAANVKMNYELVDRLEEIDNLSENQGYTLGDYYYLQINIVNLNENLFLELTNDQDDEVKTYYFSDTANGVISFKKNYSSVVNYKLTIYSNSGSCFEKKLTTKSLTVPRFNTFYKTGYCQSIPDYKYCQQLLTTSLSDNKIGEKISNYYYKSIENSQKEEEKKENGILKNITIITSVLVGIGFVIAIVYVVLKTIKRRRGL